MKKGLLVFLGVVLLAASSTSAEEQTFGGPQEAASNVYTQLFDNEKARVSEIKFNPGDKAAMHTHAYPHIVYILEGGTLTLTKPDGTSQVMAAKAGDVLYMDAETHEAVNTGDTVLRGTVTEIK